jgi:TatD DNase family protein
MFIDTHCHLNMMIQKQPDELLCEEAYPFIDAIVHRAHEARVESIINIGTGVNESLNSIALARRYKGVYATVGIHPSDCGQYGSGSLRQALAPLRTMLDHKNDNKIVAVGEIGLDFFHKPYDRDLQIDFFNAQIELAGEYNLPVVVHIREAGNDVLKILEQYRTHNLRGVIHCFLQTEEFAQTVIEWGWYVGLDAPITYPKNEKLRQLFSRIPLKHILLETDAPFLPPQIYRGKQNSPAYIPLIADALASLHGVDCSTIEETTTTNAQRLFFGYEAAETKV